MAKLIVGCGFLGRPLGRAWLDAGERVLAVTRQAARARQLAAEGFETVIGDVTDRVALPAGVPLETVVYAVGYDRSSGHSIEEAYAGGLARVLDGLPPSVRRVIYISSTGVYGQTDGEWVDEQTPCSPQRAGGRACLAAERVLAEHAWGDRGIVLRLAGLYGRGRIPRLADVQAGRELPVHPEATLNLIHVADAVAAVQAAELRGRPPACYLVADGHPVRRGEFYAEVARLLELPPPRFAAEAARSERDLSHKRIRNTRLLRELQVPLRFPSYREGLRECCP